MKSTHDNITGTIEVVLENPNSSRSKVSVLYNPNEELLKSYYRQASNTFKSINKLGEGNEC